MLRVQLRNLLRSIRVRMTLWYVLLLAVALAVFSSALYLALRITLYNNMDEMLRSSAALLANTLEGDDMVVEPGELNAWDNPGGGELFWRVLTPSGQIVEQSGSREVSEPPLDPVAVQMALAGRELIGTIHIEREPVRVYTAPAYREGQIVGVVQLSLPLDDVYDTLAALRWIVILALPATLIAASVGGIFLAGRALRPVDRITRAAQSISAHGLGQRLHLDLPDDELGRLARTFDAMIARLDDAFQRQRRFTADASHELRTPLTVVKGDLSLALARPRDADYYHQVLVEVDEEVDLMHRLVERLLTLARADAEGIALQRQTVDLGVLLTDIAEQTQALAEAKGLSLTTHIAPDLVCSVDPDVVTQIVLNLLDNAIKYTPSGRVRLNAHRVKGGSGGIQIAVADSGPGIPAEHLPHVFDRFYRVDRARSRELGGAGLGLAIARELARAHGGDITVRSSSGEGSTFSVHLPAWPTTQR